MAKFNILIAGGGDTAELLLRDGVVREIIDQVVVVESSPGRKPALERLGDVLVIEGDAANTSIYEHLNMREIDIVLALTNRDETNFLVLAIATQYNIPIRIGVFKDEKIAEIVNRLKLGIPIVKPAITAGVIKQMMTSLTTPQVVSQVPTGEYKLYFITIREDDLAAYTKLEELRLEEDNSFILMVFNGKELIPPRQDLELIPGYTLFILSQDERFLAKIKGITTIG